MHKKTLICDVLALKKKNLELLISGMRWPVSETLFFKLVNFVSREYINEIKNLTGKNYKIAVLEIRFLNLLIKIMHFNYLKNLAKKNKYTLEYSVSSKEFLYPDWKKIESLYERFYTPIGNTWNRKVKKFIKLFYFNKHIGLIQLAVSLFKIKENLSLGSNDVNKKDYIKFSKKFYKHIDWYDIIKNKNVNKASKDKIQKKIITKILKKVYKNKSFYLFIKGLNISQIAEIAQKRKNQAVQIYNELLKIKAPKEILITESAHPYHKLISSALLEKGTKVINFSHGNNVGLVEQKWAENLFYSQVGNFLLETTKICNDVKKRFFGQTLAYKENTNFFSINNGMGLKRNNQDMPRNLNRGLKKIMLIGFPMNANRYIDDAFCFFYYKLRLEIQILRKLKEVGYYTIYKTHPDRATEIGDLIRNEANECISKKFENVWKSADALIFTYTTTTTFGFALTTSLPILVIDMKGTVWNLNIKRKLTKRLEFLGQYDDNNYNKISGKMLKNSLVKAKNKVTDEKLINFSNNYF